MLTGLLSTQDIVGVQQYYCYQDKICFAYTLKSPVWNLSGNNSDPTPDKKSKEREWAEFKSHQPQEKWRV